MITKLQAIFYNLALNIITYFNEKIFIFGRIYPFLLVNINERLDSKLVMFINGKLHLYHIIVFGKGNHFKHLSIQYQIINDNIILIEENESQVKISTNKLIAEQ